jgi:signal transduction histidine kinase
MWSYSYSGYLWPAFFSSILTASLSWYAWRHRRVAGARPFALGCLFATAWSLGGLFATAAVDASAQIFWLRFLTTWQMPVVTAATFFILEYAGLRRRLKPRVLALLWMPSILFAILIATDPLHHVVWTSFSATNGVVVANRGVGVEVALGYSYLLAALNIGVLLWLLTTSPRHRWPAGLMIFAQVGARTVFELGTRAGLLPATGLDAMVLLVLFAIYALALFRFHVFDPVPAARAMAIEQMREAMFVLDLQGRIADVNPAAERMLGRRAASLRGVPALEVLPFGDLLPGSADRGGTVWGELELGAGTSARHFTMEAVPLRDKQGHELGQLLLLHEVTEQRKTQAQLVEQERVLAVLHERERLARELHDGVAQVLGFVGMQAQTIAKRLQEGDAGKALPLVDRLSEVARHAQGEVRDSILALKAGSSRDWAFLPTLGYYLESVRGDHGLQTELLVGPGVSERTFEPKTSIQLFRVIQEALTNARRHGQADNVTIAIEQPDGRVHITITDDGFGFDPAAVKTDSDRHFGLGFMQERMAEVGGSIEIDSHPGGGTRVSLQAPVREQGEG